MQFTIIASREEYLFIYAVPLDYLYFVRVEIFVGGFTFYFV